MDLRRLGLRIWVVALCLSAIAPALCTPGRMVQCKGSGHGPKQKMSGHRRPGSCAVLQRLSAAPTWHSSAKAQTILAVIPAVLPAMIGLSAKGVVEVLTPLPAVRAVVIDRDVGSNRARAPPNWTD